MADYYLKQGDDAPTVATILKDINNDPVNLTGASGSAYFRPARVTTGLVTATLTVDPDQAANRGLVTFPWPSGGLSVLGEWLGEFEITFTGGKKQTFPNDGYFILEVVPQLA